MLNLEGFARSTPAIRHTGDLSIDLTTPSTLSSFLLEMVESTASEMTKEAEAPECTPISEAIKAQGIDDITR